MSPDQTGMASRAVTEVLATAAGRSHRKDPALPRTGGPAGNAQLTAWIGLYLLPLFIAELLTLLSLRGLISWHIAIGILLIPPSLVKTTTTGWRIVCYYRGNSSYRKAGPPPLLLRLLGPLVIVSTLAILGTGITLLLLGPSASFTPFVTVDGQQISALTLHKASTIAWAAATGVHVLARLIPAARLAASGWGEPPACGVAPPS